MPIYLDSYPPRPYDVLGTVYLNDTKVEMGYACGRAKALGADAIIATSKGYGGSASFGGSYTTGNVYPGGFNANNFGAGFSRAMTKMQLVAIKWRKNA